MKHIVCSNYVQEAIDFLNKVDPDNHHIKWLFNIKNMIGTSRSIEEIQFAQEWFIQQGKIKNKDYFEVFPFLKDVLQ